MDTLSGLRQAISSKTPVAFANDQGPCTALAAATHIVLPTGSVPKSTPTRYRKPGTSGSSPQDFYTTEALYLAWHLRDAAATEYMKQTRENGLTVGFVSVTERKKVVDVLEGRIPDHDDAIPAAEGGSSSCSFSEQHLTLFRLVESTTPPGSPPRDLRSRSATAPKSSAAEPTSSPTKRRYAPDHHDAEVVKKIKLSEVELRDRNTVLRGNKPNVRLLLHYASLADCPSELCYCTNYFCR